MWVSPNSRGKKIGVNLITNLIEWARSQQMKEVALDVGTSNYYAKTLYLNMGFQSTGETSKLPSPRSHICEEQMILTL